MNFKYCLLPVVFFGLLLLFSCKKYLDKKPDAALAVPTTLDDLQLILDNYGIMNSAYPYSGEVSSDNYYVTPADWQGLTNPSLRAYYVWERDDASNAEWTSTYRVVFYANVVLDALPQIKEGSVLSQRSAAIKGAALFFRGFAFYSLAQLYAPPYAQGDAGDAPGLPLRLQPDFNETSKRATVKETWEQILSDLKGAAILLPAERSAPNRPWKGAAYAALARTYLAIGDYQKAGFYADSALNLQPTLIDFNTLPSSAAVPFARFNGEVLFPALSSAPTILAPARAKVDSVLYRSYHSSDLRRALFFRSTGNGNFSFKGSYDGSNTGAVFSGLTTAEMYLVKAEALARGGHLAPAMEALNALLITRWKQGTFVPFQALDGEEALALILRERRKELLFRGQRWTDLRRLNREAPFAQVLYRKLDAQTFTLQPGSPRYTLQIPLQVIQLTGMPQNP